MFQLLDIQATSRGRSLRRRALGKQIHQEPWRTPEAPGLSQQFTLSECHPGTAILSLVEDSFFSGTSALSCTVCGCALIQTTDLLQNMYCNPKFDFFIPTLPTNGNMTPISFGLLFSKFESSLDRGVGYIQKLNVSKSFSLVKWELQDKDIGVNYFRLINCSSV